MSEIFAVPIARTDLLEHEIEAVMEPLRSGWLVCSSRQSLSVTYFPSYAEANFFIPNSAN